MKGFSLKVSQLVNSVAVTMPPIIKQNIAFRYPKSIQNHSFDGMSLG